MNGSAPDDKVLPTGWVWTTFCRAASIASNLVDPVDWQDHPHIAPDNIERDTGRLLSYRSIGEDGVTSPKHLFSAGQLLYSKIRPYLNKCVRVDFAGLCSADMYPLNVHIDAAYLHSYILSRRFVNAVSKAAGSRTVLPKTNQEQLSGVLIPIPPLPEQRRIVSKIEELFTHLDAGVAGLKRAKALLKRYRASVLKAACEGRLVPTEAELARKEGRSYEPAAVLLQRILTERRKKWEQNGKKGKYTEPVEPDATGLPELPEGWAWTTLDQLLGSLRNGYAKPPTADSGIPMLRISSVRPMTVDLADVRFLPGSLDDYREFVVESGDLLFIRYNGNPELVGVCGMVRTLPHSIVHPDKLVRGVPVLAGSLSRFIEVAANSGHSRLCISRRVKTTAGQAGVAGADLKPTPIPLPPLAEQHRIVAEVERLLSLADNLDATLTKHLTQSDRLRQSILKRAFEGKLVPQDPTDEPAFVLLERIRKEREAQMTTQRRPRRGNQ